jgi:hypothetical protein
MSLNQPDITPITLPDAGKHWRWVGGVKPAVCDWCGREPVVASFTFDPKPTDGRPVYRAVGFDCLKALDAYARARDATGDADNPGDDPDQSDGGVREPRKPSPITPSPLEAEVEIPT